jgi:hypothetical protein
MRVDRPALNRFSARVRLLSSPGVADAVDEFIRLLREFEPELHYLREMQGFDGDQATRDQVCGPMGDQFQKVTQRLAALQDAFEIARERARDELQAAEGKPGQ